MFPDVKVGIIEASATRNPSSPCTFKSAPTTALVSLPILQVPTGWYVVSAVFLTQVNISSSVSKSLPGAISSST